MVDGILRHPDEQKSGGCNGRNPSPHDESCSQSENVKTTWLNDIVSWQYDYDIMSMTKSHRPILVNVIKWINKIYTFIQSKYELY